MQQIRCSLFSTIKCDDLNDFSLIIRVCMCSDSAKRRGIEAVFRFLPYKKQLRNSLLKLVFDPPSVQGSPRHSHMAAMLVSSLLSAYLTFQPEETTLLWHLFGALGLHITNSCCHSNTLASDIAPDLACSEITGFLLKKTGVKNSLGVSAVHLCTDPRYAQMGNACRTVKPSQSPECVTSVIVLIRQCHRLSPVTFIAHLNILLRQMVRMSRRDTELLSLSSLPWRQNAGLVSTRLF